MRDLFSWLFFVFAFLALANIKQIGMDVKPKPYWKQNRENSLNDNKLKCISTFQFNWMFFWEKKQLSLASNSVPGPDVHEGSFVFLFLLTPYSWILFYDLFFVQCLFYFWTKSLFFRIKNYNKKLILFFTQMLLSNKQLIKQKWLIG